MKRFNLEKLTRLVIAVFVVCVVAAACVIPYAYIDWYDNVVINEMARGGLTGKCTGWTVVSFCDAARDSQTWALYYFGGWLVERAYQLMGHWGPRTLLLLCHTIGALLVVVYLKSKTISRFWPWMVGLLYLTYPLIQVSVRSARVDAISLMFTFAALCCLQYNGIGWRKRVFLVLSGGFYALSVFSWASAVMMGPVVLWELIMCWRSGNRGSIQLVTEILWVGFGSLVTVVFLLIPFLTDWTTTWVNLQNTLLVNTSEAKGRFLFLPFVKLLCSFPGFIVFGVGLLLLRRQGFALVVVFVLCAVFCMSTKVIATRFYYFLPYAIAGVSLILDNEGCGRIRKLMLPVLGVMTLLSVARTGAVRNISDWRGRGSRDYEEVAEVLEKIIPKASNVYADTFELYYVGRALGWLQHRVELKDLTEQERVLSKCEYYITGPCSLPTIPEAVVIKNGFVEIKDALPTPSANAYRANPMLGPFRIYKKGGQVF